MVLQLKYQTTSYFRVGILSSLDVFSLNTYMFIRLNYHPTFTFISCSPRVTTILNDFKSLFVKNNNKSSVNKINSLRCILQMQSRSF